MEEAKYPIGIQSFENIRRGGYLYVDKTAYIQRLVSYGAYYFLSRPRRFGKSLLLSTIEAFFRGRRDLFEGLAIDSMDWDWAEYPVLHLDLSGKEYTETGQLDNILNEYLSQWSDRYGCDVAEGADVDERFRAVIRKAAEQTGKQVVILIDEYDQPLLKSMHDERLSEAFRRKLQAFFSVVKTMDPYIRFAMLTGVSRFSKVSVFSGINNLNDISLDMGFNAVCGITEAELTDYFTEGIAGMAAMSGISAESLRRRLKEDYDGYHFAYRSEDVYNPFSLLNTFYKKRFGSYWFKTGTPTFLVKVLERSRLPIPRLNGYRCTEEQLSGSDVYLSDPVPLFFQTGYLTIKDYDERFNQYILGFSNREVSEGFVNFLMKSYMRGVDTSNMITDFVRAVEAGDAERFMSLLRSFTADIPYDLIKGTGRKGEDTCRRYEAHYQDMMYIVFKLMGFYTHTEYKTNDGRIDMVVETPGYIYVMEFKVDSSAEEAMKQIDTKGYAIPFRSSGKEIVRIGASFSTATRRLDQWLIAFGSERYS